MPGQNTDCGAFIDLHPQSGNVKNIFIHAADDKSEQVVLNALKKYFRPNLLCRFNKLFNLDSE